MSRFFGAEDQRMTDPTNNEEAAMIEQPPRNTAFKIAAIYAGISVLWILFSDQFVSILIKNIEVITRIQMVKGWFFVFATSCLLFFFLQRDIKRYHHIEAELRHSRTQLQSLMDAMPIALSWAT